MASENTHHENGPSRLGMRAACSGSRKMEHGRPDTESSDAARGTMLHGMFDEDREQKRKPLSLSDLQACESVDKYTLEQFPPTMTWRQEHRMVLLDGFSVVTAGTADAVGYDPATGRASILERKFGYKPVSPASENIQAAAYATMWASELAGNAGELYGEWDRKVDAHVLQPTPGGGFTRHDFKAFGPITDHIKAIIARTEEDGLVLNAGTHCTYCRARDDCPALRMQSDELMARATTELAITRDNARAVYDAYGQHKKTLKDIHAKLKACVMAQTDMIVGAKGEGLKIRVDQGRRQIVDIQKAYETVQEHWSVEEFLSLFCSVRIIDLEDALVKVWKKKLEIVTTTQDGLDLFEKVMPLKRAKDSEKLVVW